MAEKIKYIVEIDDNGSGAKVDNLNSKIKDTGTTATNSKGKLGQLGEALAGIKGPVGSAVQGVQGLGTAFKALMANPIGALIAVLVSVFSALKNSLDKTEEGMDAVERITGIFAAVIRPLIEVISKFATVLVTGLADALETVASLFGTTATEASKLVKMQQDLDDVELELNESRAKNNKQLAQARELLSDANASLADRKKALEEVRKSETALASDELKYANQRLEAARLDQKLNGVSEQSRKKVSEAIVQVQNAETDLAAKRRLFNREAKKLDAEEEAKKKEEAKAVEDRAKELAAKQKEYSASRKEAADKIREAERKNILDTITDEEAKARKQAEFDLDNAKREIKQGKFTKAEKDKLLQAAEEANQIKLGQIQSEADKKKVAAAKKAEDDIKAFKEKSATDEAKFIDEKYAQEALRLTQTLTNEQELAKALEQLELDRLANLIQARKDAGQTTTDLEQTLANKKIDIGKKEFDAKKALDKAKLDSEMELLAATSGALKSFASLAGEQTAAGKVLAIASTVIDTYAGATKALAAGAGTPVGYINAAAIIATGLANLRTITAVQVPNDQGSGGVSTPPLINGPSVGIIQGQMSQTSQLQAEMNAQMKRPTRAYVVGQNVTTQQSLDRHILENATL